MSARRAASRSQDPGRKTRLRFGALPSPPVEVKVPYAKKHEAHADFDAGEAVAYLISRPEWEDSIGAACDAVEGSRPRKGPKPSYTTHELEAMLFFQAMTGARTYRAARDKLAGDRGARAREALGFDVARENRCPLDAKLMAGVPSEATMSRHRKRFPADARLAAYRAWYRRLGQVNAQDPELRQALRVLMTDGSAQLNHLTCPVIDPSTGQVVNLDRVTCPDGGTAPKTMRPRSRAPDGAS